MQGLDTTKSGELKGVTTVTQLPDIACNLVKFKALSTNVGSVYIGGAGVTTPKGNDNATTGLELAPGDESGWLPISNLKNIYRICDTVNDSLTYLALL